MQVRFHSCAGPVTRAWLLVHPSTLSFHLSFAYFLTTLYIRFSISHPTVLHLSRCWCDHTINDLGIYLLRCLCRSEHTAAHDMLQNTIATITSKSGAHVQR